MIMMRLECRSDCNVNSVFYNHPRTYKLNNIINVEKKPDLPKGSRFLLELNVTLLNNNNNEKNNENNNTINANNDLSNIDSNNLTIINNSIINKHNRNSNPMTYEYNNNNSDNNKDSNINQSFIISEYVYQNSTTINLCYPANVQWKRQAHVAVILPVRNQAPWVKHFLDNLQDIYIITGDTNISLVIFDFESDDINWKKELDGRVLPPYTLLQKPGVFSRSIALNNAVRAVKNPHAIVFMLDLHLEIPWTAFDDARKVWMMIS